MNGTAKAENLKRARFAERVRVRLAAMGMSASDIARQNGLSPQVFSRYIRRGPYLQYRTLERIANMLAVDLSWLLEGDLRDGFHKDGEETFNPDNPFF